MGASSAKYVSSFYMLGFIYVFANIGFENFMQKLTSYLHQSPFTIFTADKKIYLPHSWLQPNVWYSLTHSLTHSLNPLPHLFKVAINHQNTLIQKVWPTKMLNMSCSYHNTKPTAPPQTTKTKCDILWWLYVHVVENWQSRIHAHVVVWLGLIHLIYRQWNHMFMYPCIMSSIARNLEWLTQFVWK